MANIVTVLKDFILQVSIEIQCYNFLLESLILRHFDVY